MQMSLQRCLRWCDLDVLDRDRVGIVFTLVGRIVAHDEIPLLLRIHHVYVSCRCREGRGRGLSMCKKEELFGAETGVVWARPSPQWRRRLSRPSPSGRAPVWG